MTPSISEAEFVETKKYVDAWITGLNKALATKEGVTLGYKCVPTGHSLSYDIVSDSNETLIHIALMNMFNPEGKSKLIHMQDFEVHLIVHNKFWNEPLKTLMSRTYKESLRILCKNPKIEFRYLLAE